MVQTVLMGLLLVRIASQSPYLETTLAPPFSPRDWKRPIRNNDAADTIMDPSKGMLQCTHERSNACLMTIRQGWYSQDNESPRHRAIVCLFDTGEWESYIEGQSSRLPHPSQCVFTFVRGCENCSGEGKRHFDQSHLHSTVCVECVKDAVTIVDGLLA
jgi:hypothetical protein